MKNLNVPLCSQVGGGFDWTKLGITTGTYAAAGLVTGVLVGQILAPKPALGTTALAALTFATGYGLLGVVHSTVEQSYHGPYESR